MDRDEALQVCADEARMMRPDPERVAAALLDFMTEPHEIDHLERDSGEEPYFRFYCTCAWRTAWYEFQQDAHSAIQIHLEAKR
jgi:hypothetical protein